MKWRHPARALSRREGPGGALQDHQLDARLLQPVVEPHPVGHLAGEPVEARGHDDIDAPLHAPREQAPQRRPLAAADAHAQIVEALVEGESTLVLHGPHVVLAALALHIARGQVLLAACDRLAGGDGAAEDGALLACCALSAQLYLPYDEAHEQTMSFVTGVAPLTSVYEAKLPPSTFEPLGIALNDDLESSIETLCWRWSEVIWAIDAALPGPPLHPDLCTSGRFFFAREDWPTLAARIGHGADCEDSESLKQAQRAVFKSGEDDYLPLLAVNALIHAVTHQCERFELVDANSAGEGTNLWEVAADYAFYEDDALKQSWEYQSATARRLAYCRQYAEAQALFEALLKERPDALTTAEALFAIHLWNEDWRAIQAQADALLAPSLADLTRAAMLRWRGEAWLVLGDRAKAIKDARAAAELGRGELLGATSPERFGVVLNKLLDKMDCHVANWDVTITLTAPTRCITILTCAT